VSERHFVRGGVIKRRSWKGAASLGGGKEAPPAYEVGWGTHPIHLFTSPSSAAPILSFFLVNTYLVTPLFPAPPVFT